MLDLTNRPDLVIIADWIKPDSRALDLGCGDGALLGHLAYHKQVSGYGLEREDEYIAQCIAAGINIIQMDLDQGLAEFDDNSFDYVVLSLTLQAMRHPEKLLEDMLRVGREGIVTFPNFGHWRARVQLGIFGSMPFTKTLPNTWYDTPNIHLCTLKDFEALCKTLNIRILEHQAVDSEHRSNPGLKLFPNLLGEIALYRFEWG
ncbi:MAG TPA: methionine biosynthesis protein MetW [Acidiferrobacteraceae bacterium]|nr:methionine biosynthesis protein MetW [Acidiferrobacteraceae bacterium]